jgi:glycosyltransferase involved in cell wall biosynthesis
MAALSISVVVPTHDRPASLRRLLASLDLQTLPPEAFEVVVVDDGAGAADRAIEPASHRFGVDCIRQPGKGATLARNAGARRSHGSVLVFVDDDVALAPQALEALHASCLREASTIVLATLVAADGKSDPLGAYHAPSELNGAPPEDVDVTFAECKAGVLAIQRDDFFSLGMFQDPTGGWPNWDDVDFGYRASRAGYRLRVSRRARAVHHDEAITDFRAACRRWYQAGRSAVRLFRTHAGIHAHMAMFADKLPVRWRHDSPGLVARKLLRRLASSRPALWNMERVASLLDRRQTQRGARLLHRWILGGYVYRGYRDGLRD